MAARYTEGMKRGFFLPWLPATLFRRRALTAYPKTSISLEELGTQDRPYRPTFAFPGAYINAHHRMFSECKTDGVCVDIGIPGWLSPEDALKLYELAYFAGGDILELGCYHGLSTSVIASAIRDGGDKKRLTSVDLHSQLIAAARETLASRGLLSTTDFRIGDGAELCRQFKTQGKHFVFVFIDHAHTYQAVYDVCTILKDIVNPGGLCLFHDYNNPRNADPENLDYGVWQAVEDGLPRDAFQFYGVFGCTGLFRRLP